MKMRLTFLGTGTSQGVPMIACGCEVCHSDDWHDRRLRSSAMIETDNTRIIVDAGPDFRYQMLRENVKDIDAILLTHQHKDHVAGIDDVRAFNYFDHKAIKIYATEAVGQVVMKDFDYAFSEYKYPGVPQIDLERIDPQQSFTVGDVTVIPINGMHYRMPVTGFRFGKVAYLTDFNFIADTEMEKLRGLDVFVINALRHGEHISHFSLEQAIALARKVNARQTFFTHMSHQIGLYAKEKDNLPEGMAFAYDGLKIDVI